MIQPLTMCELVDRLGQAERVQTASYCRMLELEAEHSRLPTSANGFPSPLIHALHEPLEDEWRAANEMWKEAKSLVATLSSQLDRFIR